MEDTKIQRTASGSIAGVGGRPPGAKNKTTLVKEAIKEGMEDTLMQYGIDVLKATAQAAVGTKLKDKDGEYLYDEHNNHVYIKGDNACKKMLLDRMVPIADVSGNNKSGTTQVVINVQGMEAKVDLMDASVIEQSSDGEFHEVQEEVTDGDD